MSNGRMMVLGWGLLLVISASCGADDPEPPPVIPSEDTEAVCYDGFDNDEDLDFDCADSGCANFATCCFNQVTDDCCAELVPIHHASMEGCQTTVEECGPGWSVFGEPDPELVDGAVAAGESVLENGVYFDSPVDPSGSNLRVTFEGATATECVDACINYIAVGITSTPGGISARLGSAPLAVAFRPNYGDVALFRFGERLGSWPVDTSFHSYALDLRADGTASFAEIDASGAVITAFATDVPVYFPEPAYVSVFGRRQNLSPNGLPARVRSVDVTRGRCDRPARVVVDPEAVIPGPDDPDFDDVEGVGRAKNEDGVELVVGDVGDDFHLFEPSGSGFNSLTTPSSPGLSAGDLSLESLVTIDDPWLVANEEAGRFELYFTARTGTNRSVIGRVTGAAGFGTSFDPTSFVVVAEPIDSGYPKFEMPTVRDDLMIVRAANAGLGLFVTLARSGPDRFELTAATVGDARIHGPDFGNIFAMDEMEIADPALVYEGGMYRLYFAGRRGTRWRIGLLVSVGGEHWAQPLGDEALWDSDGVGFDGFSMRDPAPVVDNGMVDLLFVGIDGSLRQRVGRATSGSSHSYPLPEPIAPPSP